MSSSCDNKPSLEMLITQKEGILGYNDLLQTSEWCKKREEILSRDKRTCTKCNAEETIHLVGGKHVKVKFIPKQKLFEGIDVEPELESVSTPVFLHVHHTYYILDRLPWEYDNDSLVTLCNNCHNIVHQDTDPNNYIPVYTSTGELLAEISPCSRCHGSGYFPEFSHVEGGVCFRCRGDRFDKKIVNFKF
jgi:hypothetical protein